MWGKTTQAGSTVDLCLCILSLACFLHCFQIFVLSPTITASPVYSTSLNGDRHPLFSGVCMLRVWCVSCNSLMRLEHKNKQTKKSLKQGPAHTPEHWQWRYMSPMLEFPGVLVNPRFTQSSHPGAHTLSRVDPDWTGDDSRGENVVPR